MKILGWLLSILLGLIVLSLGLIYFLPGYDIYMVRSDSMQPVFKAGDLIISVPADSFLAGDIGIGSIIVYQLSDELVTHRIISIEGEQLTTKGDANEDPDARSVAFSQINGIFLFSIPVLGYAVDFVQSKTGWFVCILLPSFLLMVLIIRGILKEAFKKDLSDTQKVENENRFKA
jgi:signal peptidase